jgi:hypothetical protein
MRIARSAGATIVLGATLIATATSAIAADSGSHVQGIDSNGIAGIDSNGVYGIDSNGIAGIDSNGVYGIDSNGIAGIDSNGVYGIDSNGIAGIDSNGVYGIDSNGIAGIDSNGVLAGPVERIDIINGVFHSMGQVVMASKSMLSAMRVGDFVTVDGSVVSPGWLYADAISVSDISYVPGATKVFVSGMLTAIDVVNGTARMGGLTINYTATLGNGRAPSGSMWSFEGTRPQSDGVMVSDRSGSIR